MNEQAKRTALPWAVELTDEDRILGRTYRRWSIVNAERQEIARTTSGIVGDNLEIDARLIVRAVNHHAELASILARFAGLGRAYLDSHKNDVERIEKSGTIGEPLISYMGPRFEASISVQDFQDAIALIDRLGVEE